MCSLRGFWILKLTQQQQTNDFTINLDPSSGPLFQVIFSRRFPTVERRTRLFHVQHQQQHFNGPNSKNEYLAQYHPLPTDFELLKLFTTSLRNNERNALSSTSASSSTSNLPSSSSTGSLTDSGGIFNSRSTTTLPSSSSPSSFGLLPNVISIKNDSIWPVVFIKRNGFYFLAITAMEPPHADYHNLTIVELPSITSTLVILEEIASVFMSKTKEHSEEGDEDEEEEQKLKQQQQQVQHLDLVEFNAFLTSAIPFGKPIDTNFAHYKQISREGFPPNAVVANRRPANKPYLFKGKQAIDFWIQEEIRAVQYDNELYTDRWEVSGVIQCRGELEGLPEVTVSLSLPRSGASSSSTSTSSSSAPTPPSSSSSSSSSSMSSLFSSFLSSSSSSPSPSSSSSSKVVISDLCVDSCVQSSEGNKLVFSPPLEKFTLCRYATTGVDFLPIRGFYQMKELSSKEIKILIQLKLNQNVNNNFEYCEAFIPFPNRGLISHVETTPTAGTISVDPSRQALVWTIGQRFTARNHEVALPAAVFFDTSKTSVSSSTTSASFRGSIAPPSHSSSLMKGIEDDPFLVSQNCYVKLSFKVLDYTFSGLNIDPRGMTIYPTVKPNVSIDRTATTAEYLIWNSLGKVRVAATPEQLGAGGS